MTKEDETEAIKPEIIDVYLAGAGSAGGYIDIKYAGTLTTTAGYLITAAGGAGGTATTGDIDVNGVAGGNGCIIGPTQIAGA